VFLKQISQDIISTHGNNLAKIAVIFPNKRASLWMNDYLLEAADGAPVFAPQYFSISEFFQKQSKYTISDRIQLISILHKSYNKITGETSTLDKFYAWGEILLSDFDNVDKSLADVDQLFSNISGLHEMDSIDYLSEEQKELLERFFHSFTRNHESSIQQKFISLWNNLASIYYDFKAKLSELGIAYEGMLYRDVVENANYEDFSFDHYYAVGFNQLLKCEQKLFLTIADKLTQTNDDAELSTVNPEAKITIAQSLTDDLQSRYIESWLKENNRMEDGRKTAIILCDEHLLPSAIYGLPDNPGPVNITAGFPLTETQPASFIDTLLELFTEGVSKDHTHFRASYLRNLYGHSLYELVKEVTNSIVPSDVASTKSILEKLEQVITTVAQGISKQTGSSEDAMLQEATFKVYNIITRLKSLNEQDYLDIEPITLARLYKQIVVSATIPFHGEPAKGIQIMGVLETRNLDFDHILMLSCNEGVMPQGTSETSAIPYSLKKAFELNTTDDRANIFAYYFYRLLKRCKDVTLVYNASGSDTSPGEMSRFLLNLIVNNSEQISRISLNTNFQTHTPKAKAQTKTAEELHRYIEYRKRSGISPSAINTYMRCEKMFYYQYFRNLSEETEEDETMDAAAFGDFFHNAAESFYRKFIGENITASVLQEYIDKPALLDPFINSALKKTRDKRYGEGALIESGGMEHLLKRIIRNYLYRVLKNDIKFCPFRIVSLEQKYTKRYAVATPEGKFGFDIGGFVDRLDCLVEDGKETLRVVDYKTGTDHLSKLKINSVEDIFEDKDGANYYRQAFLYSIALSEDAIHNPRQLPVAPALYFIRNQTVGSDDKHNPIIPVNGQPVTDISAYKAGYEEELSKVLSDIFNKNTFEPCEDANKCDSCPFKEICME